MHSLAILPSVMNASNYKQFLPYLERMVANKDTIAAPYIAFLSGKISVYDKNTAQRLILSTIKKFPENIYVADAIINSLYNKEAVFLKQLTAVNPDTTLAVRKRLERLMSDISNSRSKRSPVELQKEFPKGVAMYKSVCQICHGQDGNGIKSLGPPLNNSEWVTGNKKRLIPIVLYGLIGPVKVHGVVYAPPEISGEMPGISNNKEFTDQDLAQVMSYIRAAWSNNADKVTAEEIKAVRQTYQGRQKPFTADELNKIK
jgi:mono/diheme cytochrome c family protein